MTGAAEPRLVLLLSEIWSMTDPRQLDRVVGYAVEAEAAGFDGVMIGEHVVLGPSSGAAGLPTNPRDWLRAGNQDPRYPHPSSLMLLGAISSVTTRLRLMAAALNSPLRHPLVLAKELATLDLLSKGRLVVLPSASWQQEEYEALGVPFHQRGEILDEELEVWRRTWHGSPVTYHGTHFHLSDIYVEPQPFQPAGPVLWFGGRTLNPRALRRTVAFGQGLFLIAPPSGDDLDRLGAAMAAAGRRVEELELVAFVRGRFTGAADLLDLDTTLASTVDLWERGITTFVIKPSQFIDDGSQVGTFCRRAKAVMDRLIPAAPGARSVP